MMVRKGYTINRPSYRYVYRYTRTISDGFRYNAKKENKPGWWLCECCNGRKRKVGRTESQYWRLAFLFAGPVESRFLRIGEYIS